MLKESLTSSLSVEDQDGGILSPIIGLSLLAFLSTVTPYFSRIQRYKGWSLADFFFGLCNLGIPAWAWLDLFRMRVVNPNSGSTVRTLA